MCWKKSTAKGKLLEKNDNVAEKSIMKAKWVRKNCSKSFKWEISVEPVHHALLNWQSQKGTLNIHC